MDKRIDRFTLSHLECINNPKGDIYQGPYVDDKKQGQGLCKLAESTLKEMEKGEWRKPDNLQKGQSVFECQHEDDNLVYVKNPGNWLSRFASGFVEGLTENLAEDLYVSAELPQTGRVMVKDEDLCVHCGLCAERCPTGAWDMQKSTILLPKAKDESESRDLRKVSNS